MAKRGSRRTDGANEQTQILRAIWNEMKTLNARIDALRTELKAEMKQGFDVLGGRIDNLLRGEHGREHAELRERVARLEDRIGLRPGGRGPP